MYLFIFQKAPVAIVADAKNLSPWQPLLSSKKFFTARENIKSYVYDFDMFLRGA